MVRCALRQRTLRDRSPTIPLSRHTIKLQRDAIALHFGLTTKIYIAQFSNLP
ncbi:MULTISPECIES: hypothetical protein [Calothrix]|uniref:Uncharacterized protein n=2 Tax=Calothrix TaxID=1186 RepID=A0ABR8AHR0_9CYAN|nr:MULTISPECIES: hypothetical protein [Calothrix]MBD2199454.1 hypothetical protein [Calothrix parietina FACHB-288]MBD2228258.1 hypothetical protein [Calothrix anomala FACHB-343]